MIKKLLILSLLTITSISQAEQSDNIEANDEAEIEQTASVAPTTSETVAPTSEFLDTTSELLDKYVVQPVKTYIQTPSEETKATEPLVIESPEIIQASAEETKKIEPSLGSFEDYYGGNNSSWVKYIPFYEFYSLYKEDEFISNTGKMYNLPILRNANNGKKDFFDVLKKKWQEGELAFEDPKNIELLKNLIANIEKKQHHTGSDLLNACVFSFQLKEYKNAISFGGKARNKLNDKSLVDYIMAVSSLYAENLDIGRSLKMLESSLSNNSQSNPIPYLCFVIYLDRFIALLKEGNASLEEYGELIKIAEQLNYGEKNKEQAEAILAMFYIRGVEELCEISSEISDQIDPLFSDKKDSPSSLWRKYNLKEAMTVFLEDYSKNLNIENENFNKLIDYKKVKLEESKDSVSKDDLSLYTLKAYYLYIIAIVIAVLLAFAMLCCKIFKVIKKELILTNQKRD